MNSEKYYIGLDAGTSSLGWAVTTPEYNIVKKSGKALWGSRLFNEASTAEKRRLARSSRRRRDRQAFRQSLLRELFGAEIAKCDPAFFMRLDESKFWEEDKKVPTRYSLFANEAFTDREYFDRFPTIYHLRNELMKSEAPHDVRLVYLACAHIIKHRGHFLMQMSASEVRPDFTLIWNDFLETMQDVLELDVSCNNFEKLQNILCEKIPSSKKEKALKEVISVSSETEISVLPCIYKLLSGGTFDFSKPLGIQLEKENKNDLKLCLNSEDLLNEEKLAVYQSYLGDKMQVLFKMQEIFDWGMLAGILQGASCISEAKVRSYEKHKADLDALQDLIKKELPERYNEVFRIVKKGKKKEPNLNNYCAYTGHFDRKNPEYVKNAFRCTKEDFYKYIKKLMEIINNEEADRIKAEIELGIFLPLQHDKENSVIPYQMNLHELQIILEHAAKYLPFLKEKDADGISVKEKIESLVTFRVPYYVGPLDNTHAKPNTHWAVKKEPETRVLPWNFDRVVDKEACAEKFMEQLTNTCTYLIGESVIPKDSITYSHFMALNELNNVTVCGERLPVEVKQKIFRELFLKKTQVKRKDLIAFLRKEGLLEKGEEEAVGGIDGDFKASLKTEQKLRRIFKEDAVTDEQLDEMILSVILLKQEPEMLRHRIQKIYPAAKEVQVKSVCQLPCSGWGRLSKKFLTEMEAALPECNGEIMSILDALWNTQYNLMQLLANHMPYKKCIDEYNQELFEDTKLDYASVEKLFAPPAVRRTIWQAVKIVKEITHIMKGQPDKIFVEMAKGADGSGRTRSRKTQLEELYKKMGAEGAEWQEDLQVYDDARLRQDKLYLYFTQMGKCMYTGKKIDLSALLNDTGNQIYDIDHIYPRSRVKDDSLDNRVLVMKKANQLKGDIYPISSEIRTKQFAVWSHLYQCGLISKRKLDRLTRGTGFNEEELAGFISRQLVETRQSTKLLAQILSQALPETRIVYVKAGAVSDFRRLYDFVKVRDLNDLHHAKDAYLNVVVGNVYDTKFTNDPRRFIKSGEKYSMKPEVIFKHTVKRGSMTAWDENSIETVRKNYRKNNIFVTRMTEVRNSGQNGGFYDQNPVSKGPIPLKKDPRFKDIEKYGGYKGNTRAYFMLVEHRNKRGKKRKRSLEPMYLRFAAEVGEDKELLLKYCENQLGLIEPEIIVPKIQINTLIEIKGFPFWITGSNEQSVVGIQSFQLVLPEEQELYLKSVLKTAERCKSVSNKDKADFKVSEKYDKITDKQNLLLYDIMLEKMQIPIYASRAANQTETIRNGREKFKTLSLAEQCTVLSSVLKIFRAYGQADLKLIGGKSDSGKLQFTRNLSGDFKIIYQSVTGFYSHEDRRVKN